MSLPKELKMKGGMLTTQHEALLNIVRTATIIGKLSNAFFGRFGITEAQYNVLIVLKLADKPLTQVEIGERLVVSRANMTALLDKLEKKAYVIRKKVEGDRRIFQIELTKEGRKLLDKVEPAYLRQVESNMACLNLSACKALSRVLTLLRENLHITEEERHE
ncbi:MAG: MarR family transcriptional regulator [Candidatus Omnitrophica bacterium]|nr:MarR family transcriptional regulator [Candidatus Omnitrophota bacterium]